MWALSVTALVADAEQGDPTKQFLNDVNHPRCGWIAKESDYNGEFDPGSE